MKKAKSTKCGLKALNDIYLLREDPIDWEHDAGSGLNKDVVEALKSKRLILPDVGEHFAKKFPCTGTVVSKGNKCKYSEIAVGGRVSYARLGVQRFKWEGEDLCAVRECDLHGLKDD